MGLEIKKPVRYFNWIYSTIVILIFILILGTLALDQGRDNYNNENVRTYLAISMVAGAFMVFFLIFGIANATKRKFSYDEEDEEDIPIGMGFVSESTTRSLPSISIIAKIFLILLWTFVVFIAAKFGGLQIWGDADLYSNVQLFASNDETQPLAIDEFGFFRSFWEGAVIPGFSEDGTVLGISAAFIALFSVTILILKWITGNEAFSWSGWWENAAIIVACPLAAVGTYVIPGFAQAHESVGGSNITFLAAAAIFQTINLYVMWITRLFLPLPHIVHNSVFIGAFAISTSVAVFIVLPIIRSDQAKSLGRRTFSRIRAGWPIGLSHFRRDLINYDIWPDQRIIENLGRKNLEV